LIRSQSFWGPGLLYIITHTVQPDIRKLQMHADV